MLYAVEEGTVNVRFLYIQERPERLKGLHNHLFNGCRSSFSVPGPKLDHSPPSRAEDKNEWSDTSTLPIRLHSVDRDSFAFYFTSVIVRNMLFLK